MGHKISKVIRPRCSEFVLHAGTILRKRSDLIMVQFVEDRISETQIELGERFHKVKKCVVL